MERKKKKKPSKNTKKNLQEFRAKIKHVGLVFELRCSMKLTFQMNFVVATRVFFVVVVFFHLWGDHYWALVIGVWTWSSLPGYKLVLWIL